MDVLEKEGTEMGGEKGEVNPKNNERTSVSPEAERTSVSHEAERTSVSPEAERTSVSHEAERTSVSHEAERTSVSREAERTSVSRDAERTSVSREAERTSVSHEAERTSVSHEAESQLKTENGEEGMLLFPDLDSDSDVQSTTGRDRHLQSYSSDDQTNNRNQDQGNLTNTTEPTELSHKLYKGNKLPFDQLDFRSNRLKQDLLQGIRKCGFEQMASVQSKCIPEILSGNDCFMQAAPRSGKTVAALIGVLQRLPQNYSNVHTLLVCHSRELVLSVHQQLVQLSHSMKNVRIAKLIGGIDEHEEAREELSPLPHIIVGTDARIVSYITRAAKIQIHKVRQVVVEDYDVLMKSFECQMNFRILLKEIKKTSS